MRAAMVGLTLLLAPMTASADPAPELAGDWEGSLDAGEGPLPVVLHFGETVTGDSPSQGVTGIPATVERVGDKWRLEFKSISASYEATLDAQGRLTGTYSQDGVVVPLTLTRKPKAPN